MSTLLAMIFSMSILGGCSPSYTETGSATPAGLYLHTPDCKEIATREVTRGQVSTPVAPAGRLEAPKRTRGKRLPVGKPARSWVPERVPASSYLNNRPYGRR